MTSRRSFETKLSDLRIGLSDANDSVIYCWRWCRRITDVGVYFGKRDASLIAEPCDHSGWPAARDVSSYQFHCTGRECALTSQILGLEMPSTCLGECCFAFGNWHLWKEAIEIFRTIDCSRSVQKRSSSQGQVWGLSECCRIPLSERSLTALSFRRRNDRRQINDICVRQILRAIVALTKSDKHLKGINLIQYVTQHDRPYQKIVAIDATNISVKTSSKQILRRI
jgi:hypothetical protein